MFDKLGTAAIRLVVHGATIALVLAGSLMAGAPAQAAAFTCAGEPATILGPQQGHNTLGTAGDDVIVTFGDWDYIRGGGGNDLICAGAGNDTIEGSDGIDIIYGEDGQDEVRGGYDDWMFGGNGNDNLMGRGGRNSAADGGPGNDKCTWVWTAINCERD